MKRPLQPIEPIASTPINNPAIAQAFAAFPPAVRKQLKAVRALIFRTAAAIDGVGPLDEVLKWGEPAYITARSGSGSTIRLGWKKSSPEQCAVYFTCHTNLVETFRSVLPDALHYEGNRAIVIRLGEALDTQALAWCIGAALTYQRDRKTRLRRTAA